MIYSYQLRLIFNAFYQTLVLERGKTFSEKISWITKCLRKFLSNLSLYPARSLIICLKGSINFWVWPRSFAKSWMWVLTSVVITFWVEDKVLLQGHWNDLCTYLLSKRHSGSAIYRRKNSDLWTKILKELGTLHCCKYGAIWWLFWWSHWGTFDVCWQFEDQQY